MPDRPKPIYKTETPGPWIFDEGDPGYPATRMEPGDPGYPPRVYAFPPEEFGYDNDDDGVMICELNPEPVIPALDHTPESTYDEGLIAWGDFRRNGKLIAAAPEMWNLIQKLKYAPVTTKQVEEVIQWASAFEKILEMK